jgi:hypothetical protein
MGFTKRNTPTRYRLRYLTKDVTRTSGLNPLLNFPPKILTQLGAPRPGVKDWGRMSDDTHF